MLGIVRGSFDPDNDVARIKLRKIMRADCRAFGLLKNLGLVIGQAKMNVFAVRATELAEARPELAAAIEPLLKAREAIVA